MDIINAFYQENEKIGRTGVKHFLSSASLSKKEAYALYEIIQIYKPKSTLEIGLAFGASTIAIISAKINYNKNIKHIALDPFQDLADFIGVKEIEKYQLNKYFEHKNEFSEFFLNAEYINDSFYDFIFIDGNHTIGQAVTDAFLADKILNKNGIIGIHDSLMFSTAASIKYLTLEKGYKIIDLKKANYKTYARQLKFISKLGIQYCTNVIPYMCESIVFLKKP